MLPKKGEKNLSLALNAQGNLDVLVGGKKVGEVKVAKK